MRRRRENKRKIKLVIGLSICLLLIMTVGYAAFQTNLNITAKGNIKNIKDEVDSKVPTDELLFWGQSDNEENTLTLLKDKSGNNHDGIMYDFDNTNLSGYTDDGLVFDGIDDYVDIGLANYDFQNSISYVVYVTINSTDSTYNKIICNQENAGSALEIYQNNIYFNLWNGQEYVYANTTFKTNQFYTIIGVYDGFVIKLYFDGELVASKNNQVVTVSPMNILLGANPQATGQIVDHVNMNLKEAMVYDRALTEDEVKTITEGFERKYK